MRNLTAREALGMQNDMQRMLGLQAQLLGTYDRAERGVRLLQQVPDNCSTARFTAAEYDDIMFAARQCGAQFGGLLQWTSPHTIKFRGAQILKGK